MSEARFWTKVRGALHDPPRSVCRKLSDQFTAGTPDAFFIAAGCTIFLELKYDNWPKRPTTPVSCNVSVEQYRYLDMLVAVGTPAFVLLGVGKDWFLLSHRALPVPQPKVTLRLEQAPLITALTAGVAGRPATAVVGAGTGMESLRQRLTDLAARRGAAILPAPQHTLRCIP